MPTVLRIGPYRFYFFSHETTEPPHIHIDREKFSAKFWLQPLCLAGNVGFSAHELRKISYLVSEHSQYILEKWYEYFGNQNR